MKSTLSPKAAEIERRWWVVDGAVGYRDVLLARGGCVPPADEVRHLPRARFIAALLG